jgi:hypothetical protein
MDPHHKWLFLFGMFVLWGGASPAKAAFGQMELQNGTPEFESCLKSDDCASRFYRFFSESTLAQGFAMQDVSPLVSALHSPQPGGTAGIQIQTFPLGPPPKNLAGKEENTQFSPVFPKLLLGYRWQHEDTTFGSGLSFFPPIPIQGASAMQVGLQGSYGRNIQEGPHRWGLDLEFTFVQAHAPVTASKDQFDGREEGGFEDNLKEDAFMANCDVEIGCTDIFTVANLSLTSGLRWALAEKMGLFAGAGFTWLNEFFQVEYDDTTWALMGLQPFVQSGIHWEPTKHWNLLLEGRCALKQENQSTSGMGVFYRFGLAGGYHF